MLLHPTIEKLRALKLPGMARALEEQQSQRDIGSFTFEERLGLLLDHESTLRDGKVLAARLSRAKLKLAATPEDVDFKAARGLDKTVFMALMDTNWVTAHRNVLISWLFCWTETGAEHVGVVQSLLSTCRLCDIDPYEYLVDVLQRVKNHPPLQMGELTPRRWKELFAQNPKRSVLHLIDQMRKKAE